MPYQATLAVEEYQAESVTVISPSQPPAPPVIGAASPGSFVDQAVATLYYSPRPQQPQPTGSTESVVETPKEDSTVETSGTVRTGDDPKTPEPNKKRRKQPEAAPQNTTSMALLEEKAFGGKLFVKS